MLHELVEMIAPLPGGAQLTQEFMFTETEQMLALFTQGESVQQHIRECVHKSLVFIAHLQMDALHTIHDPVERISTVTNLNAIANEIIQLRHNV